MKDLISSGVSVTMKLLEYLLCGVRKCRKLWSERSPFVLTVILCNVSGLLVGSAFLYSPSPDPSSDSVRCGIGAEWKRSSRNGLQEREPPQ
jgi:hypothetical protein